MFQLHPPITIETIPYNDLAGFPKKDRHVILHATSICNKLIVYGNSRIALYYMLPVLTVFPKLLWLSCAIQTYELVCLIGLNRVLQAR